MKILNVNKHCKKQIVKILAEAFDSDPVFNWICSETDFPRLIFDAWTPSFFSQNYTYITDDESGTALCLPPGVKLSFSAAAAVLWKIFRSFGFGALRRALRVYSNLRKHHYPFPHFYLFAVGVLKEAQGKGLGSILILEITGLCDAMNMPAYLENSNEKNLALYQRNGFHTIQELKFDGGPTLWLMLREPRKPGAHLTSTAPDASPKGAA